MSNPFEDPAVAAASNKSVPIASGENGGWGSSQPDWNTSGSVNIESKNGGGGGGGSGGFFSRFGRGAKEAQPAPSASPATDLQTREQQLQQREQELQQWQADLRRQASQRQVLLNHRNFPPFCPIVHNDIANDIPIEHRWSVRWVFYSFLGLVFMLFYQTFCLFLILVTDGGDALEFVLSILYIVFGVPGAWFLWYRNIYEGAARDSAMRYFAFFMFYMVNFGFCIYCTLAPNLSLGIFGSAGGPAATGWLTANNADRRWLKVMFLIGAVGWTGLSVLVFFCISMAMKDFRGRGGPQQLQKEATRSALQAAAKV